MSFAIRPALLLFVASLLVFTGCTIRPKFTPTTESSKTFQIMYQDSASPQPDSVVTEPNEALENQQN